MIKLDEFIVRKSGLRSPDFLVLCFLNGSFLCSLAKLSPYSSRTPWPPIYLLLWCVLPLTHVHARYMLCQAVYHIRLLSISIRVCQSASTENTIVRLVQVSQPVKCEYYHHHHQNLPSPWDSARRPNSSLARLICLTKYICLPCIILLNNLLLNLSVVHLISNFFFCLPIPIRSYFSAEIPAPTRGA